MIFSLSLSQSQSQSLSLSLSQSQSQSIGRAEVLQVVNRSYKPPLFDPKFMERERQLDTDTDSDSDTDLDFDIAKTAAIDTKRLTGVGSWELPDPILEAVYR